jgi:twinkle protein
MLVDALADHGIRLTSYREGQRKTQCPRCHHLHKRNRHARDLSIKIDDRGATWTCHHCRWKGFVLDGSSPDFAFNRKSIASIVAEAASPALVSWQPLSLSGTAYQWFQKRGISMATVDAFGVGMARNGDVLFPYREHADGPVVNYKQRDIVNKGFRQAFQAKKTYFALDRLPADAEMVIIVEGELDVLACYEAGRHNVISVPDGAPQKLRDNPTESDLKFSYIGDTWDRLDKIKRFVIAVDGDEPGKVLREELARRYGRDRCWYVEWPEGCKDSNDVLLAHGPEALADLLKNPKPFPVKHLRNALDYAERLDTLYERGFPETYSVGFDGLDEFYRVGPGQLTIVTGIPGSGKSEFVDQVMCNLAARYDFSFGVCSFENPVEDHIVKLLEKLTGYPYFGSPAERMTREVRDKGLKWLAQRFHFIRDEERPMTIDDVLSAARAAVARHNIRGLVIDPYNFLVRPADLAGMSETEYVSNMLSRVLTFAKLYGVHVWFIAHPAKQYRSRDGEFPVPSLGDISGSQHWFNKADMGMVVHRCADESVDVIIPKVRFKYCGRRGQQKFAYNRKTGIYEEAIEMDEAE